MFVKVHKPVNTPCVCDNKDRCRALVEYLLKESLEDKPYYDTFFSHEEDYVPPVTVMQKIDSNHKKLMKGDDKFYMLSINPSQDEAAHLIRKVTAAGTAAAPAWGWPLFETQWRPTMAGVGQRIARLEWPL